MSAPTTTPSVETLTELYRAALALQAQGNRAVERALEGIRKHAPEHEAGIVQTPAAVITDGQRLDWLEKNYLNAMGSPRFQFSPRKAGWHASLAAKFPNGFWYKHWQTRDAQNQFSTLREAIDSVMSLPPEKSPTPASSASV